MNDFSGKSVPTKDSLSAPAGSQERVAEIDAALDRYTQLSDDCPPQLREAIRYSLLAPGKRLRPQLVLLAAEACGGSRGDALPAACAVEMVHAYSLVHDDLPAMDDDDMRRGRMTCHKAFGEATAILVGDALLALAFEVVARHVHPSQRAAASLAELAHAAGACQLVGGQFDDLEAHHTPGSLAQLEAIHDRKTGALFRASLKLGGIAADASAEEIGQLDAFGNKLGLAFQIVDDLLDVSGDQQAVGKRVGKDQEQGKLTFPAVMGNDESRRQATQLVSEACAGLVAWGDAAAPLIDLAQFILRRRT